MKGVYLLTILTLLAFFDVTAQIQPNFESGTFSGWTATSSVNDCQSSVMGSCLCYATNPFDTTVFNQGPNNNRPDDAVNKYNHIICTSGTYDSILLPFNIHLSTVWPGGGSYSARMGNAWQSVSNDETGDGETTSYSYVVSDSTDAFIIHYAMLLSSGDLDTSTASYFKYYVLDSLNNIIPGTEYDVNSLTCQTRPGYIQLNDEYVFYYKPWGSDTLQLTRYIGQKVKIVFVNRGCLPSGCAGAHYAYEYLDCEVSPNRIISSIGNLCPNMQLIAPVGYNNYVWTGPNNFTYPDSNIITIDTSGWYYLTAFIYGDSVQLSYYAQPLALSDSFTRSSIIYPKIATILTASNNFANQAAITYTWIYGTDTTVRINTDTVSFTFDSAGTYFVQLLANTATCSASRTLPVIVTQPNTTPVIYPPYPACTGSQVSLSGNSMLAFGITGVAWILNGDTISTGFNFETTTTFDTIGLYRLQFIVYAGIYTADTTITFRVYSLPTTNFTFPKVEYCHTGYDTLVITDSTDINISYRWYYGANIYLGAGPVVVPLDDTDSLLSLFITNSVAGCINQLSDTLHSICTDINQISNTMFGIYPNPAGTYFNISFAQTAVHAQLNLHDVLNRTVLSREINTSPGNILSIPITNLEPAIYFVTLYTAEGSYTQRLVISH